MTTTKSKNIALVLGSGGARGLAHIGVIEEFEKRGYQIQSISGCSIGAVIGGVYAAGYLKEYKEWILSLDRRKVFGLMDFTLKGHGFIKGERVFDEMKQFIGELNIEDLKIPYSAIAVDLENQEEVVFSKGDLWNAIRASVAIPSVLTPVVVDNRLMVDGGVVNPLPVNRVERKEHDILAAVDLNALNDEYNLIQTQPSKVKDDAEETKFLEAIRNKIGDWWPFSQDNEDSSHLKKNYLGILNASFEMMQDQVAQLTMQHIRPDILIKVPRKSAGVFDFYKADTLIEMGRTLAVKALNQFENKTEE